MGELREYMRLSSGWGKARDIEEARVGGLDGGFVGHLDSDAISGGLLMNVWSVDQKKMSGASGVSDCICVGTGWGVVGNFFAIVLLAL
jgi:hypothetical protein